MQSTVCGRGYPSDPPPTPPGILPAALVRTFEGADDVAGGGRFGPDQNGVPDEVDMSSGKLYSSCATVLWKSSSNLSRAHTTQLSSEIGWSTCARGRVDGHGGDDGRGQVSHDAGRPRV